MSRNINESEKLPNEIIMVLLLTVESQNSICQTAYKVSYKCKRKKGSVVNEPFLP